MSKSSQNTKWTNLTYSDDESTDDADSECTESTEDDADNPSTDKKGGCGTTFSDTDQKFLMAAAEKTWHKNLKECLWADVQRWEKIQNAMANGYCRVNAHLEQIGPLPPAQPQTMGSDGSTSAEADGAETVSPC